MTLPSEQLRTKAIDQAAVAGKPPAAKAPLPSTHAAPAPAAISVAVEEELPSIPAQDAETPAGDSRVQREVETLMLDALAAKLFARLVPERVTLSDGSWVEIDGVSHEPPMLVEAWAHQGPSKGAQRNKVLADALKLVHVAKALGGRHRMILCFSDDEAMARFTGPTWYAGALRAFGVECHLVKLDEASRQRVLEAQRRQFR
ncbi:hypothetical protein NUM3379_16550 [Kineococcus sp. NUM-3379]